MITKKHYIEIARILNKWKESTDSESWDFSHFDKEILNDLITYFQSDNPDFNKETFRKAVLN